MVRIEDGSDSRNISHFISGLLRHEHPANGKLSGEIHPSSDWKALSSSYLQSDAYSGMYTEAHEWYDIPLTDVAMSMVIQRMNERVYGDLSYLYIQAGALPHKRNLLSQAETADVYGSSFPSELKKRELPFGTVLQGDQYVPDFIEVWHRTGSPRIWTAYDLSVDSRYNFAGTSRRFFAMRKRMHSVFTDMSQLVLVLPSDKGVKGHLPEGVGVLNLPFSSSDLRNLMHLIRTGRPSDGSQTLAERRKRVKQEALAGVLYSA